MILNNKKYLQTIGLNVLFCWLKFFFIAIKCSPKKTGVQIRGGGVFFFWRAVQYIEEFDIYLCFVVYRLKGVLVT